MSKLNWYIIKVVSNQEDKVKLYLDTEIIKNKLHKYIARILIPYERIYEVRKGKKKN